MKHREQQMEIMPYDIPGKFPDEPVLQVVPELPLPGVRLESRESFLSKTARQHLMAAKRALADGYKLHKNPMKTAWGRVADAKRHLEAVKPRSKEYAEARKMMKLVHARQVEIEKVSALLVENLMVRQREMLVDELDFLCLTKGLEVRITLSGPGKSFFAMESATLCETFVHKMARDTDFLTHLEKAGFRKVSLGDGDGFIWQCSFEK